MQFTFGRREQLHMSGKTKIEAPRKYRPSNGTEGMGFIDRWCAGAFIQADHIASIGNMV